MKHCSTQTRLGPVRLLFPSFLLTSMDLSHAYSTPKRAGNRLRCCNTTGISTRVSCVDAITPLRRSLTLGSMKNSLVPFARKVHALDLVSTRDRASSLSRG